MSGSGIGFAPPPFPFSRPGGDFEGWIIPFAVGVRTEEGVPEKHLAKKRSILFHRDEN